MIIHYDAFEDYCKGLSQKEMAKKYSVSLPTINRWSSKEFWRQEKKNKEQEKLRRKEIKKQKRQDDFEETVYQKFVDKAEESISYVLDHIRIGSKIVAEEQENIYQQLPKKYDLARQEQINRLGKTLSDSLKNIIPQVSEELGEAMLKEMQEEIKENGEKQENEPQELEEKRAKNKPTAVKQAS